jgi:uncharacterized protein (DUF983 family)
MDDDSAKWPVIEDSWVVNEWMCPECLDKIFIPPTFYADGTPICGDCGYDMVYTCTRIKPVQTTIEVLGGIAYAPIQIPKHVKIVIEDYDT